MNTIKSTLLCISFIAAEQITAMESQRSIADWGRSVEEVSLDQSYLTKSYTYDSIGSSPNSSNKTYTLEEAKEELKKNPGALHDACQSYKGGNYQKVEMLIKAGADVNAVYSDFDKWTPLHHAACGKDSKILTLLIKNGADVNAKDEYGDTPLHIANSQGTSENIEILVKAGADINTQDKLLFYTPLMNAAADKFAETKNAIKLIELGANINYQNNSKQTALHLAAREKHLELTQLLLEKSADPFGQNKNGWTALHFAARRHFSQETTSTCAIILGNLGFFDSKQKSNPNPNQTLQKLIIAKLLEDSDDLTAIIKANEHQFDSLRATIIQSIAENQTLLADKELHNIFITSIRNQFISKYYKQKLFTLAQTLLSIKNKDGKTATKIADIQDQKTIALLTQVENAQSYSEFPQEIKAIAKNNIEKHIQWQN